MLARWSQVPLVVQIERTLRKVAVPVRVECRCRLFGVRNTIDVFLESFTFRGLINFGKPVVINRLFPRLFDCGGALGRHWPLTDQTDGLLPRFNLAYIV